MEWTSPPKPAELTEGRLIDAILSNLFPPGSLLPAERELAQQLGVTRPTLREALQRLARDGWIDIRQGKPTRVRNYWQEGSLGVLGALAQHQEHLPENFIPNLLAVRQVIAPAYARLAIEKDSEAIVRLLEKSNWLIDNPTEFAAYDWEVHHGLSIASGNPIYTLILNGFRELYQPMACQYFELEHARRCSQDFYKKLLNAAWMHEPAAAEEYTRQAMEQSQELWIEAIKNSNLQGKKSEYYSPGGA